jgi:hypothetical protein
MNQNKDDAVATNENNDISDAKLKAYVVVSAIGVAVILIADFMNLTLHKGLEWMKMIGPL